VTAAVDVGMYQRRADLRTADVARCTPRVHRVVGQASLVVVAGTDEISVDQRNDYGCCWAVVEMVVVRIAAGGNSSLRHYWMERSAGQLIVAENGQRIVGSATQHCWMRSAVIAVASSHGSAARSDSTTHRDHCLHLETIHHCLRREIGLHSAVVRTAAGAV